jgi:hypothetical protein
MENNGALVRKAYNYERRLIKKYWVESLVLTFTLALLAGTANPLRLGLAFVVYPNLVPLIKLKGQLNDPRWSDPSDNDRPRSE